MSHILSVCCPAGFPHTGQMNAIKIENYLRLNRGEKKQQLLKLLLSRKIQNRLLRSVFSLFIHTKSIVCAFLLFVFFSCMRTAVNEMIPNHNAYKISISIVWTTYCTCSYCNHGGGNKKIFIFIYFFRANLVIFAFIALTWIA